MENNNQEQNSNDLDGLYKVLFGIASLAVGAYVLRNEKNPGESLKTLFTSARSDIFKLGGK